MAFWGKRKRNDATPGCGGCIAEQSKQVAAAARGSAGVKVLGSGCPRCNALETAAKAALETLDMDSAVDHVTDFSEIAAYGVMATPALVIDGKVVSCGKLLRTEEIVRLLQQAREPSVPLT